MSGFNSAQEALGDPSGNANSAYWDAWFKTVSAGTAFEWYTSSKDLHPLLDSLCLLRPSADEGTAPSLLHVGTGNSDLVTDLALTHDHCNAVAIDISPVAITEMQTKLDNFLLDDPGGLYGGLRFVEHDVLNPFDTVAPFDGVIDKGLFDAMMGSADEQTKESALTLFNNMAECTSQDAPYVCISLGEAHVVELLVHVTSCSSAFRSLNVIPLAPASSTSSLQPFAFVLTKAEEATLLFNKEATTTEVLGEQMTASRAAYATSQAAKVPPPPRMSLLIIEIKPYEAETDLEVLAGTILAHDRFKDVTHRKTTLVPVGYGISKMALEVVMREDDIDDLVEFVTEEWEDEVQSVDVGDVVQVAASADAILNKVRSD